MLLWNFVHKQQQHESDCLAACAEMALQHIGVTLSYTRLSQLLKIGASHTPFTNIQYLESLGLHITIGKYGDLSILEENIEIGLPVIVAVQTIGWQHWGEEITEHAVVVVGIDQKNGLIYIHDPFFVNAPIEMNLIAFEAGWIEREQEYAVIGLAPP